MSLKSKGVAVALGFGDPGGVGGSIGLIDCSVLGSLCSYLSSIMTCCGDSICLPVNGMYVQLSHSGKGASLTSCSSSMRGCLGSRGVVQIGGNWDNDIIGGSNGG